MVKILEGQMSIFDFLLTDDLPVSEFCFDKDINDIVANLDALLEPLELFAIKKEFRVWAHVPAHGYRLTYLVPVDGMWDAYFSRDTDRLAKIVKKPLAVFEEVTNMAYERKVELSVCFSPSFFHISSMFLDNRKKNKF